MVDGITLDPLANAKAFINWFAACTLYEVNGWVSCTVYTSQVQWIDLEYEETLERTND